MSSFDTRSDTSTSSSSRHRAPLDLVAASDLYPEPLYNARDALHAKPPSAAPTAQTGRPEHAIDVHQAHAANMSQTFMNEHARFIDDAVHTTEDQASSAAVRVNLQVDLQRHRYPFCLVWGPLPLITWLFPWIGHLGIGDSEGKVHDFAGPYFIGVDSFMTPIHKYYQFPRELWLGKEAAWNLAIHRSDAEYRQLMHNICCQNCHHHSARALELTHLPGVPTTMFSSWWLITRRGKFVSTNAWLCTYMPLMAILAFVLIVAVALGTTK